MFDIVERDLLDRESDSILTTGGFATRLVRWLRPIYGLVVYDQYGTRAKTLVGHSSIVVEMQKRASGAQDGAAGLPRWFRGAYIQNPLDANGQPDPYLAQQVVIVPTGTYQGTYVCVQDNPTVEPWQGVQWIKLPPPANSIGNWQ